MRRVLLALAEVSWLPLVAVLAALVGVWAALEQSALVVVSLLGLAAVCIALRAIEEWGGRP